MSKEDKINLNGEGMLRIINDLCAFGYRRAGTPPAGKAEKYIYDKLKEAGMRM